MEGKEIKPDCHFQDESGVWMWAYSEEKVKELQSDLEKATELIRMAQNLPEEKAVEAREKFHEFMIKSTTFLEGSGLTK